MTQSDAKIVIKAIRLSPLKGASRFTLVQLNIARPKAIILIIIVAILILSGIL